MIVRIPITNFISEQKICVSDAWKRQIVRRNHRQVDVGLIKISQNLMSLLQRVCKTLGMLSLVIVGPAIVSGQSSYVPQAGEYLPAGGLAGDQTHPQISLKSSG